MYTCQVWSKLRVRYKCLFPYHGTPAPRSARQSSQHRKNSDPVKCSDRDPSMRLAPLPTRCTLPPCSDHQSSLHYTGIFRVSRTYLHFRTWNRLVSRSWAPSSPPCKHTWTRLGMCRVRDTRLFPWSSLRTLAGYICLHHTPSHICKHQVKHSGRACRYTLLLRVCHDTQPHCNHRPSIPCCNDISLL